MNPETKAQEGQTAETASRITALENALAELKASVATLNIERISTLKPVEKLREPLPSATGLLDQFYDMDSIQGVTLAKGIPEYAEADRNPVPALEDREYYYPNQDLDYWLSGLRDFLRVRGELRKVGAVLAADASVLEIGAASGRVMRHFAAHGEGQRLHCCDVNYNHVDWINRHLPEIFAFQNTSFPVLPIADNSYDLVTAFSVFTHIDELEGAWLMEINRILKPGGHAYITVQSERVWDILKNGSKPYDIEFQTVDGRKKTLTASGQFLYSHLKTNQHVLRDWVIDESLFAQPMPEPRVVFRFNTGVVYNTCTFHSVEFMRDNWGKVFDWVDFFPAASSFQDAVLLRKRRNPGS